MRSTRLSRLFSSSLPPLKGRGGGWDPISTLSLLLLLVGFLVGNLLASLLEGVRSHLPWDGLALTTLVASLEMTSLLVYGGRGKGGQTPSPVINPRRLLSLVNALKIGLLLGVFVDGFKVGS